MKLILIISAVFIIASCNNSQQKHGKISNCQKAKKYEKHLKKDCKNVHWSHKGEDGPKNWKNLCDGFKDCGANAQSPININSKEVKDASLNINFDYKTSTVDILNNGHTVQFNVDGDNKIIIDNEPYKLLQFHYHALSEHTIDNKHFPLEVHFVHKNSDTKLAVVGIMFVEGESNKLFEKYLNDFPTAKGNFKSEDMINLINLMPEKKNFYNYKGSLTTPPCSEIVNWFLFTTPIQASKEQLEKFSKILKNNYRPVLPLNNREVKLLK